MNTSSWRILLVDDLPSIHDDFRKILLARPETSVLDEAEAALFGNGPPEAGPTFELDSAYQGQDGVAMVQAALKDGRPYAMAFVDMRMPPGWDGAETIERLWQVDPEVQVVICTAYSDHPWEQLLSRLDARDRLLILKKPFDVVEVSQLASTLTAKWDLARNTALRVAQLEDALRECTRQCVAAQGAATTVDRVTDEGLARGSTNGARAGKWGQN